MGLAILGVVVLLYILLAYFAAKTWQVWHVVLMVFLFLGTGVFLILAAATMKVQDNWRGKINSLTSQLEQATSENEVLQYGSVVDETAGEIELRNEVRRALVDRGRVWRNLQLAGLGDGQVLLNATAWTAGCIPGGQGGNEDEDDFADEEPVDEGAAPADDANQPTSLGLEANSIVYAFKEASLPVEGDMATLLLGDSDLPEDGSLQFCRVPAFYVGEFRVVGDPNANPGALTLEPTMELSEQQIQELEDQGRSWALYEIMPVDSHRVFEGMTAEQMAQLIQPGNLPQEEFQALLSEYARDLQRATDVDPPQRKWVKVRFKEAHTEAVDVDVEGEGTQPLPLADSMFDPSGRSLVATLSQGEETQFSEGDEAEFDWATAQELINSGKAELVEAVYHRRLRDYARFLRTFTAELEGLDRSIAVAEADLQKLNDSIADLQQQIAFRSQQRDYLEHDLEGLNRERTLLVSYGQKLDAKWNELRESLSRLYRTNRQLVSQMVSNGR